MKSDGQHANKPDCGCHTCLSELAVIKNEPKELGKYSKQFKNEVRRKKIYSKKPITNHPLVCKCKSHWEKMWDSPANTESLGEKHLTTPPLRDQREPSPTRVENLRKKFDTINRTMTKHQGTIPVHTSR